MKQLFQHNSMNKDSRLLTENEKKYILDFCAKKENLPPFAKHPVLFTALFLAFAVFFGCFFGLLSQKTMTGLLAFFVSFAIMMIFVLGLVIPVISGFRTIPESIKNDQMYVQEATYEETVGKSYMIFVTMKEKGRSKYGSVDLLKCEKIESGDRIIILQKRGRKWAFKARK